MKALVKQSAGPGFTLRDVPVPTIRENEVLIKVRRAGVCGTDVHIYEWDDVGARAVRAAVHRGPRVRGRCRAGGLDGQRREGR